MLISSGTQARILQESPTQAGSTVREGSVNSDSLLATLWVRSVSPGATLSVRLVTLTEGGEDSTPSQEYQILQFPDLTAPTTQLLVSKAAVTMQRFRVYAAYTGAVSYEIYVRALASAAAADVSIQGSKSLVTSQITVGTTPVVLIPSALTDRTGLVVKQWQGSGNLYMSEDSGKLPGSAWPLAPKDALALDVAAGVTIYALSDSGDIDVRLAEA